MVPVTQDVPGASKRNHCCRFFWHTEELWPFVLNHGCINTNRGDLDFEFHAKANLLRQQGPIKQRDFNLKGVVTKAIVVVSSNDDARGVRVVVDLEPLGEVTVISFFCSVQDRVASWSAVF